MKLRKYRVKNFKNILDSRELDVDGHITCLVGKNESGKTALLEALRNTNPADSADNQFNVQVDYPKREVEDPNQEEAVVECHYELEDTDIEKVEETFGAGVLTGRLFSVKIYYDGRKELLPDDVEADRQSAINNLADKTELSVDQKENLKSSEDWSEFIDTLNNFMSSADTTNTDQSVIELANHIHNYHASDDMLMQYILDVIIQPLVPKFFYLDKYSPLKGSENIKKLVDRGRSNDPRNPDKLLISLYEMAGLNYLKMEGESNNNTLENTYGGSVGLKKISERVTDKILKYWSQNKHLKIELYPKIAGKGDKEGRESVNVFISILDTEKVESSPLDQRSKGFISFLSLLVQYASIKQQHEHVILLLDEPGLHLHGKAQSDLLKCFDEEFSDTQIIYTTHSPFMVDVRRLDRIRVVHDSGSSGAKVSGDALSVKGNSLLPLQAALGYGLTQSLFIAPNCLVVEGVSDMLFLKAVSDKLIGEKRTGLSPEWNIIPTGGIGKVQTFVSIIKAQEDVNAVVLVDSQKEHRQRIANLHEQHLLEKERVLTYTDFLDPDCKEGDVEDLFERTFYVELVNAAYKEHLSKPIEVSKMNNNIPRVVVSIAEYLKKNPLRDGETSCDHYKPSRYFYRNSDIMWEEMSDDTKDTFEKLFKRINKLLT